MPLLGLKLRGGRQLFRKKISILEDESHLTAELEGSVDTIQIHPPILQVGKLRPSKPSD